MEQKIFSSEAAKELGIGVSTLRNYAVVLEGKGYKFDRGPNNGRIFRSDDINVLKNMMENISQKGMTIEQAAASAAGEVIDIPLLEESVPIEKLCEQLIQLEQQQAMLAEANFALAKQVERLAEKMEERERDQELFQRLHNTKEKNKRKGIAFFRPLTNLAGKK